MRRIVFILSVLSGFVLRAQGIATCDTNDVSGQNLVVNGGFEDGDQGFSVPLYRSWNKTIPRPGFSVEGDYFVGANGTTFNNAFSGSPKSGNNFLMIDGRCDVGNIVWEQQVHVQPNTRYFFEANIASLFNVATAELSFEIAGEELPEKIIAPSTVNTWISYVDSSWFSGNNEGPITIRIRNSRSSNCSNGNDFAIDDISFSSNCFFGGEGLVPDLGADKTLCGTSGTIELAPNVPNTNSYQYKWSTGDTTATLPVSAPGSYTLCMTTNGSCVKTDQIVITDSFQVSLGEDRVLCSPATAVLESSYEGVAYDWFLNDTLIPQFSEKSVEVNEVGTYKVIVSDNACPPVSDSVVVTSRTFTARNNSFCLDSSSAKSLSLDNITSTPESYVWYTDATLIDSVNSGITFLTPEGISQNTTYYIKDVSTFEYRFGPVAEEPIDPRIGTQNYFTASGQFGSAEREDNYVVFEVFNTLVLDSVSVYPLFLQSNSSFDIGIQIREADGNTVVDSRVTTFTTEVVTNTGNPQVNGAFRVPIGIRLEPGTYRMYNTGTTQQILRLQGLGTTTPLDLFVIEDVIAITDYENKFSSNDQWPFFFDWKVSSGVTCDAVQASLLLDSTLCGVEVTDTTPKVEVIVPNAFSPNGDNINDEFEITNISEVENYSFKVFNQWGDLVYESDDKNELWDGTRNGNPLPVATYFYALSYDLDGESITKNNYIALLR